MTFSLDKVVCWGRSYSEYIDMFRLSIDDLAGNILGCGDGPAGFNAVLSRTGGKVVSIDPIYQYEVKDLEKRIQESSHEVLKKVENSKEEFVWEKIRSVDELGRIRMSAMQEFLRDYPLMSIMELCRVAREVRVFPLLELGSRTSRHLNSIIEALREQKYQAEIQKVPYEFQKEGNEMLKVRRY